MFYKQPGVWRISETDTGIERDRGRDKESANVELCIESRGFSWSGGRARHPALQHSLYALVWEASQWEPQNTSSTKKREENMEPWVNPQSSVLASRVFLNTDNSLITDHNWAALSETMLQVRKDYWPSWCLYLSPFSLPWVTCVAVVWGGSCSPGYGRWGPTADVSARRWRTLTAPARPSWSARPRCRGPSWRRSAASPAFVWRWAGTLCCWSAGQTASGPSPHSVGHFQEPGQREAE